MILIKFRPGHFEIKGHSGAGTKGSDVVCAAVSALSWTLIYGIQNVLQYTINFIENENGALTIEWASTNSREEQILVETILGSLNEISKENKGRITITRES